MGFFQVRRRQIKAPSTVPNSSAKAEICKVPHRPPRMVFQEPPFMRIVYSLSDSVISYLLRRTVKKGENSRILNSGFRRGIGSEKRNTAE